MDKEITVVLLNFPDNIRKRPGMFIGSIENPSVLLREAVDNSIDEIYGCRSCNKIIIDTTSSKWYTVSDNGRGIPIALSKEDDSITMAELAVSRVNAGSKFDKGDEVATGMNGVGIKATNALSNEFLIISKITKDNYLLSTNQVKEFYESSLDKNNLYYFLYYKKGIKIEEGCSIRESIMERFQVPFMENASTITAFIPDDTIFKTTEIKLPSRNLKYLSYIARTIFNKSDIIVEVDGKSLEEDFEPFNNIFTSQVEGIDGELSKFIVSFEFDKNLNCIEFSGCVNSLPVDRGIHIELLKNAYKQALKNYFSINHDYLLYGIRMNVVVLAGEVDFSSQTKERLTKLPGLWASAPEAIITLQRGFNKIFKENEDEWRAHVARLEELYRSMVKISTIDRIKSMVNISSNNTNHYKSHMPPNVDDASSGERDKCSLYIVEGQSAGGNMIKARDTRYDAIFYLRGKPLNAVSIDQESLLNNREMNSIISAIGIGVDEYQVTQNPHFGKIIIATDADPDGSNIAAMLIAFFCARMRSLVEAGMLYVVQTPLFIQGEKVAYLGDNVDSIIDKTKPFSRIKGLGELDSEELESHIFNENTRRLIRITLENAQRAIDLITSTYARKMIMSSSGILRDPYELGL